MRINYQEFAEAYVNSGLSRKAFGQQQGMSANMVSYYLKRSQQSVKTASRPSFKEIQIISPEPEQSKCIKILTADGVRIEIPM